MSFAKSPRQVRSGANTIPTPRRSASGSETPVGEVRLALDPSAPPAAVKPPAGGENNSMPKEPPMWICIGAGVSSIVNLTAFLLIVHKWTDINEDHKAQLDVPWKFAMYVAHINLGWWVYTMFLGGALGLTVFGIWGLMRYPKMRAHGPWSLLFISVMLFNFNFALFMKLETSGDEGKGYSEGRAKAGWTIFLISGGLVSGLAAIAATRTKVWRPPMFGNPAWLKLVIKTSLALGIFVFGIAAQIAIVSRKPSVGFLLALASFTIMKLVMLGTLIANHIARNRQSVTDEEHSLLVDQDTAT
jgi:hypothetical protein